MFSSFSKLQLQYIYIKKYNTQRQADQRISFIYCHCPLETLETIQHAEMKQLWQKATVE